MPDSAHDREMTADPRPGLEDIRAAAARIESGIIRTPIIHASKLSDQLNVDIWLKLETLQHTGSFKERGALNKLLSLTNAERQRGVVAASAGNHAQGVARHAAQLGITATIVMPRTTPEVKIRQTKSYGANVVLHGLGFDDSQEHAKALCDEAGSVFIHPFDDPDIIAGQGTIALEMLADGPEFDAILPPIGGGGLCSGMAIACKAEAPDIEIIGAQAELFPAMANQFHGVERPLGGDTLAEGIAVKKVGDITRDIIKDLADDIVTVDERRLERALSLLLNEQNLLAEGAGAAGLAAILTQPDRFRNKTVGLVLCGGNIDTRLLSMILMRDLARAGRLARLRIQLLDMPGQLVRVASIIADLDGNVIDVGHHRTYSDLPAKMTCMDVTIDTQGQAHLNEIIKSLQSNGYAVELADY